LLILGEAFQPCLTFVDSSHYKGWLTGSYSQHFIFFAIYKWGQLDRLFDLCRARQPSVTFVGKVRSLH
jgi:hypothetical protein